jgi:hypothetical protein
MDERARRFEEVAHRFDDVLEERDRRYQERFEAQSKAIEAAFNSAKEAATKVATASEKRFESVNEFRAQQQDLIANFITRTETEQRMEAMRAQLQLQVDGNAAQIAGVMKNQAEGAGRRIASEGARTLTFAIIGAIVAVIGIAVAILVAMTR